MLWPVAGAYFAQRACALLVLMGDKLGIIPIYYV